MIRPETIQKRATITIITLAAMIFGVIVVHQVQAALSTKDTKIKELKRQDVIHAGNYLDLSKRYDKTRADYKNLAENDANWRDRATRLEKENQTLKSGVSRGAERTGRRAVSRGKKRSGSRSLEQIKMAESGGNYKAKNPRSSASGAYQFLDSTWRATTGLPGSARDYPKAVQDEAARKLYAAQGSAPWAASAR